MQYLYLAIFVIFTSLHLVASAKNNKEFRNVTKGFILFSLLGFYLEAAEDPSWIVVLAILFSWIGDLFLIPNGVKWFVIGGLGFMASHIFFIIGYAQITDLSLVNPILICVIGAIYITAVIIIFTKLRPHLINALFYPMFLYLLINGTMNSFALFRFFTNPGSIGCILTAIGAILFFMSDTALFFKRFNKNGKQRSHFFVMLTYSIGELLIVLGLVL